MGIFRLVFLLVLAVCIWALVDAAIRPALAYPAAGKRTKIFWVALLGGAVVLSFIPLLAIVGIIAAIVYLVDVRPAIREVTGRGNNRGGWA